MKIVIVSDACDPPTNGVSRTLGTLKACLERLGHQVTIVSPPEFLTVPCPTYPEIRLAVLARRRLRRQLEEFRPDVIHVATEGPLGWAARGWCLRRGLPFTTMFTTKFPEAIELRFGLPTAWTYALLRHFHAPSSAVMVATASLRDELWERGFRNLAPWTRGVDTELFRPRPKDFLDLPRPIFLYVGRIAVEKSIEDFLRLDLPGTKLVVGDGPHLPKLRREFPDATFVGSKRGEDLARYYAASDVFVFPSRTETFGLVVLEALASGLPVAAYPVTGPLDIVGSAPVGVLDEDLGRAARQALALSPDLCRAHALRFSWENCAQQFLRFVQPVSWRAEPAAGRLRALTAWWRSGQA